MKKNICYILLILTLFISISILNLCRLSQLGYAILMCSMFLVLLLILWSKSKIAPFFLFMLVFSLFFVGGRFWAFILSPDEELFYLQAGTFFLKDYINNDHWIITLSYIICFMVFAVMGYCSRKRNYIVKIDFTNHRINYFLQLFFWPLACMSVLTKLLDFIYAFRNGGYLAMYEGQTESYSSFSSLGDILLYVSWGMAFTFGDKSVRKKYLILLLSLSVITILIGSRGAFGSFLMLALWLYSQKHKINIQKLFLIGAVSVSLLLLIFSFSIRALDADDVTGANVFSVFLYKQGVTLAVFDQSRDLINYPIIGYFQNFIPGSSFFYSHFIKPGAYPYELTFDGYLSYSLNENEYMIGHGLGWSVLSDLYIYSLRNIFLFSILAFFFGLICAIVENRSCKKPIYNVIMYSIFFRFMILPRAGLNTIVPFIWYVIAIYFIYVRLSMIIRHNIHNNKRLDYA